MYRIRFTERYQAAKLTFECPRDAYLKSRELYPYQTPASAPVEELRDGEWHPVPMPEMHLKASAVDGVAAQ